jgi:hypothetical protein
MSDFGDENVLTDALEAFAGTIAEKLRQLRRYIPKERARTNTDLTGAFIEELVRGFIRRWIGQRQLLHGTFYFKRHVDSGQKPLQIDGIVYDPTRGPEIVREGDFVIVHPAFCGGVIEVKMTVPDVWEFEERLQTIHKRYMSHRTTSSVMGVVIADANPEKVSHVPDGPVVPTTSKLYHPSWAGICPIFVLFKETDDGDFEPHYPAIEGLIQATHFNLAITTNYL